MSNENEAPKDGVQTAGDSAKITVTPEVLEKIEEMGAKTAEKLEAKIKKFKFHGGEQSEKEMKEAQAEKQAADYITAAMTGDFSQDQTVQKVHETRKKAVSDANTGVLVPEIFESRIFETFDGYDEVTSQLDIVNTSQPGKVINLNELDTRVQVYYDSEDYDTYTASTPTYTEPELAIDNLVGSTDITQDFLEDTEADIMSSLSRQYAEAMAQKFQNRVLNGNTTVSSIPTKGLFQITGATTVSMVSTGGGYSNVTYDDFDNMYFEAISIDHFQDFNKSGNFIMAPLTLRSARDNLLASSNGQFFTNPYEDPTLRATGQPIIMTNQAPTPATTTSNPFAIYGNLREHVKVRRKRGITMKVNTQGTSKAGRNLNHSLGREIVVTQRIGHKIVLQDGLVQLVTA